MTEKARWIPTDSVRGISSNLKYETDEEGGIPPSSSLVKYMQKLTEN
jgi:hypothetical protein